MAIYNRHLGKHWVANFDKGDVAVVVIDDDLSDATETATDVIWNENDSAGHGLEALAKLIPDLSPVRGIGFFMMPTEVNDITVELVPAMKAWLGTFQNTPARVRILADAYQGPWKDEDTVVGEAVHQDIKSLLNDVGCKDIDVAWFSKAPPSKEGESVQKLGFRKDEIGKALSKKQLPPKLRAFLGVERPRASFAWRKVHEWNRLRHEVTNLCQEICREGKFDWAHHCTGGGAEPPDQADKDYYNTMLSTVKETIEKKWHVVATLPEFDWEEVHDWGCEKVPGWDAPPFRALVQFDSCAHDLTRAFEMVRQSLADELVKQAPVYNLNPPQLVFNISIDQDLDFCWFNVGSLGEGIFNMGHQFLHQVSKLERRIPGAAVNARIIVGLRVEGLHPSPVEDKTSQGGISITVTLIQHPDEEELQFPPHPTAKNKLLKIYSRWADAGFKLSVTNGILTLGLTARCLPPDPSLNGPTLYEVKP